MDFCQHYIIIPTLFYKSIGDIAIASVRPSVTLSPPKLFDKNQPNLVCVLHMNGVCNGTFFWPRPLGPGEGPKGQILLNIFKFQLQSQFQRFLNQTLCVYSKMKYIKHIRQDFHSGAWMLPQGWDLRGTVGGWGSHFFSSEIQPELMCE